AGGDQRRGGCGLHPPARRTRGRARAQGLELIDAVVEPRHEPGPVVAGRRLDTASTERLFADVKVGEFLTAGIARLGMRRGSGRVGGRQLAIEKQRRAFGAFATEGGHTTAAPRATSTLRRRCTALCSCRFTVPSCKPSASAISCSFRPS